MRGYANKKISSRVVQRVFFLFFFLRKVAFQKALSVLVGVYTHKPTFFKIEEYQLSRSGLGPKYLSGNARAEASIDD